MACTNVTARQQEKYDWLLIYYMPYDNNLSDLSSTIIDQIKNADYDGKVGVTLQADLEGAGGMSRYIFDKKNDSFHIEEESSASSETLTDYLIWVANNYKAKHYAIIFLNHGGKLNEYGSDQYPDPVWMPINEMANAISEFNKAAQIDKIDLLFEQICTRATVENLYEFREVAKFTLASQDLLPAPGYYYTKVISALSKQNIKSGSQLADLIIQSEKESMYYSLSLIDNSRWDTWLSYLDEYVKELQMKSYQLASNKIKILVYEGQSYFDFSSLVVATTNNQSIPKSALSFQSNTKNALQKRLYINPGNNRMKDYSGLSICSPFSDLKNPLSIYKTSTYSSYLSILQEIRKN